MFSALSSLRDVPARRHAPGLPAPSLPEPAVERTLRHPTVDLQVPVHDCAPHDASLDAPEPSMAPQPPSLVRPLSAYWAGRSGRVYRHEVQDFVHCAPLTRATYVLVRRAGDGHPQALYVGTATSFAPTFNLAHLRRTGARLGATEVHVHATPQARGTLALRRIARDLRAALL